MKKLVKNFLVSLIIFSMLLLPAVPAGVNAYTSLTSSSATISDSAPGVTGVTYTFDFETSVALALNDTIDVTFPSEYTGNLPLAADVTCPATMNATVVGLVVTCTATGAVGAGALSIIVNNVTNPTKVAAEGTADTYIIEIETSEEERAQVMVAIIEKVVVTARVNAILEFYVDGINSGQLFGTSTSATTTTATTTPTSIPFGLIEPGVIYTAAQQLRVGTNASQGYNVNIFQDQDLSNSSADTINCFDNATCVPYTGAQPWGQPDGTLDDDNTYGHFGISSEDISLGANCANDYYTAGTNWAGLSGISQAEVMCHNGPSDGSTLNKGLTKVGFRVEITTLQQAGDYTNQLTYIVTPTF